MTVHDRIYYHKYPCASKSGSELCLGAWCSSVPRTGGLFLGMEVGAKGVELPGAGRTD